jgi:transposase
MNMSCVGIDIAKKTFVVAVEVSDKVKIKSFNNSILGFNEFIDWLNEFRLSKLYFCMESTGKYGDELALYLYEQNYSISVVNPARIKYFAKSQLTRNKTDSIDAKVIMQYCKFFKPSLWKPAPIEIKNLETLVKRVDSLNEMITQETNRLEKCDIAIKSSIEKHIQYLKKEVDEMERQIAQHIDNHPQLKKDAELLDTIPGIGKRRANKLLTILGGNQKFNSAKEVAAYVGLNPEHSQSGTSLNSVHLSKTGSSEMRKMLYMPALTAIKYKPILRKFYEKLISKGKPKKLAICAVMRKFWHIIYGVLKNQSAFNEKILDV